MVVLIVLVVGAVFGAAVGFVLGYVAGRRSAAKERQSGFPVAPAATATDRRS